MKIIDECDDDLKSYGFSSQALEFGIVRSQLSVKSEKDEKKLGWRKGEYRLLTCPNLYLYNNKMWNFVKDALVGIFKELMSGLCFCPKKVLVVGLGNEDVVADSFGANVAKRVFASGHIENKLVETKVYVFCPMVKSQSGLETSELVGAVAKNIGAELIVLVDSLLTANLSRLAHSFQFSSAGLVPGGAVGGEGLIDQQTMGIATFSVGVPFMINLKDFCDSVKKDIIVAPKDIGLNIRKTSELVAKVINCVLFENLSEQELSELSLTF